MPCLAGLGTCERNVGQSCIASVLISAALPMPAGLACGFHVRRKTFLHRVSQASGVCGSSLQRNAKRSDSIMTAACRASQSQWQRLPQRRAANAANAARAARAASRTQARLRPLPRQKASPARASCRLCASRIAICTLWRPGRRRTRGCRLEYAEVCKYRSGRPFWLGLGVARYWPAGAIARQETGLCYVWLEAEWQSTAAETQGVPDNASTFGPKLSGHLTGG